MYVHKTIYSRYIGMHQKHQIPMYPKKEYIGTPPKPGNPDVSLFIQYRHLVVVIVLEVIGFGASEVDNQKHDQQGDD